jgi:RNA polymerase sigma factor (sigma-70 family)
LSSLEKSKIFQRNWVFNPLLLLEGFMPTKALRRAIEHLQQTLTRDEELLERFLSQRDEIAFATLVKRHGPMVLGVCRRILANVQDSEDAFQATFLILARKARSVVNRQALAGWLYTVASRTAAEARAVNARRQKREKQVPQMPQPVVAPAEPKDWQPLLDEELNRLPEKQRTPVVLCDLEGLTRREAAGQLGVPEGTLSSRLISARRKLAQRLARRGVVVSGGALAAVMSQSVASASIPPALIGSTAKGAVLLASGKIAAISAPVAALMKGAMKAMFLAKLKVTLATIVVLTVLGAGGFVVSYQRTLGQQSGQEIRAQEPAKEKGPSTKEINELIKELGSARFKDREAASHKLDSLGLRALPALRKAIAEGNDLEVKRRAEQLLMKIENRLYAPIRAFKGHTNKATCVVFSADGKQALSSSDDHTVRLWEVASGKELRQFNGHTDMTLSVTFADKGKKSYSCSGWPSEMNADKSIRCWDLTTGKELSRLLGHTDTVWRICLSPDGKTLASTSRDNTMRLWDLESGKEIRRFLGHTDWVRGADFSPDGKQLVSGSWDSTLRLWDVESGRELRRFTGHKAGINSVAFSPDGKLVLSGGGQDGSSVDNDIRLWELTSGKVLQVFKKHTNRVWHVTFAQDGKRALSSGADGAICLWDIKTGRLIRTYRVANREVRSVAFSPDRRHFLSASDDGVLRMWPLDQENR